MGTRGWVATIAAAVVTVAVTSLAPSSALGSDLFRASQTHCTTSTSEAGCREREGPTRPSAPRPVTEPEADLLAKAAGGSAAVEPAADSPGTGVPTAGGQPTTAPSGNTGTVVGTTGSAGSVEVGSAAYPVPPDAVVVSPSGDDTAAGTEAAPLRTVARAVAVAPSGATIVLRAGGYHESVELPPDKTLTVQSYPHEAVWFDGSSIVTGWARSGAVWVRTGWTAEFDSSPCYTPSSCETSDPDFQFISGEHPMAAHPDQVWVGGEALRQVASVGQVVQGTFFVDYGGDRLYVGSDPTGQQVRASDLAEAISVRSVGSTLRGFGVHRYATPVSRFGSVKAEAEEVTLENMVVSDNATTGISVLAPGATLRSVTADRNGMLGIHANYADGLEVVSTAADDNNSEQFKAAPVAGGIKITRSRGVRVTGGRFEDNLGTGVWFDESVYDITLAGSTVARNAGHGVSVELSAKAVIVDNLVADNTRDGVKFNNSDGGAIWNNTFVGNNRSIWVVQDPRLASDPSTPGHDPRQPVPDPTVTWLAGAVTISNNVFSHPATGSPCVLCVEDTTNERSASDMKVASNGNVYNRSNPSAPQTLIRWQTTANSAQDYPALSPFVSATGQDRTSAGEDGAALIGADGMASAAGGRSSIAVAQPLPAALAAVSGRTAGERHLGRWTD